MRKVIPLFLSAFLIIFLLAGCRNGNGSNTSANKKEAAPKVVKVGYIVDNKPTAYKDESGKPTGLEIEVLKLVDKKLKNYKFEYHSGDQESVLLGVDSNKYQIGLGNFFKTPERAAKYIYPKQSVGISLIGLVVAKKYAGKVNDLQDVHNKHLTFVPLPSTNGNYTMLQNWNKDHPNKAVKIDSASQWNASEAVKWVAEGRYDVMLGPASVYKQIVATLGLDNKVAVNNPFSYVESYAIFHKDNDLKKLASEYDSVVKQLKANGTLDKLGKKFYKEDVYHYFDNKKGADQYRWN
jgi:L-cystine transport system substrate-binding protein